MTVTSDPQFSRGCAAERKHCTPKSALGAPKLGGFPSAPRAVRGPRCRRPRARRIVGSTAAGNAALAQRIRRRVELLLILRASELAVGRIGRLDAGPAAGSHATAIDALGDLVLCFRFLDTLAAVGLELRDAASRRFPVVLAAAGQKNAERKNQQASLHRSPPFSPMATASRSSRHELRQRWVGRGYHSPAIARIRPRRDQRSGSRRPTRAV